MTLTQSEIQDIWHQYYGNVYGYFFKRISNSSDVDDLTSMTMTSFIAALETKQIEHPAGFLWRIARNQLYNYIKNKSKKFVEIDNLDRFEELETTEDTEISTHYKSLLEQVLAYAENTLNPEELQILRQSYFDGQTSTQIATQLHITPDSVRMKLSRTLKKLRIQANLIQN
jgi:RNA polymerase sigma factor (sigma-70 family)